MFRFIYNNCNWLVICWFILIFILCSTPGQYIPTASWLELLSFDKWVHASIFFVLAFLAFTVAVKKQQSSFTVIVYLFLCILYGGLLEIMQAKWFSNRSADWQDFVANSFGVLVALFFIRKIRKWSLSFSGK